MSISDRKAELLSRLNALTDINIDNSSNFKFMNLFRSRLMEEGIGIDVAQRIVASLNYDMSATDEDDDYIGQVALIYAEFVEREYKRLVDTGWHRNLTDDIIRRYLTPISAVL